MKKGQVPGGKRRTDRVVRSLMIAVPARVLSLPLNSRRARAHYNCTSNP